MSNYVHNLAVYGTHKQLKAFREELNNLGYNEYHSPNIFPGYNNCIVTNFMSTGYDYFSDAAKDDKTYKFLNLPQDHDLALALAGMRSDEKLHTGEYCKGDSGHIYKVDKQNVLHCLTTHRAPITQQYFSGHKMTTVEITTYFESLPKSEEMEERKIIGYKAPYDLFGGKIEAGTVYVPSADPKCYTSTNKECAVVKEIVERWEPVYEDEKVVKELYINAIRFQISKEGIYCATVGKWISPIDIQNIMNTWKGVIRTSRGPEIPYVDRYTIVPETFKIGCTSGFKREDIKRVLKIYNDLQ